MSVINYLNGNIRTQILHEMKSDENAQSKKTSKAEYEIYQDRLLPHVEGYLKGMYDAKTVDEMPIVASINLAKRIVNQEARIYLMPPKRTFNNVTEEQEKVLLQIYSDMEANSKMLKANQMYKLQNNQTHLQIVPINGKLKMRVLMRHQMDAIPSPIDPETADAYLVTGFDYSQWMPRLNDADDGMNQLIADNDDYLSRLKLISLWSDQFNFIMDENGNIVSGPDVENKIGMTPFVDVSSCKDSEYWVRAGSALTDFTIQFNAAESDTGHVNRMQGFAQAYMIAAESMMPQNVQVGPNFVLKMSVDPNNPITPQFGFANPNPDLAGSIQYLEQLLSVFLTSRGVDPKIVNTKGNSDKFSSGIERFLSMIDQFEPSRSDFDVFAQAEKKIFEIVKAYVNTYAGTDVLQYSISQLPEDATMEIEFGKPELITSQSEKIANAQAMIEIGAMSKVEMIMELRGVSKEAAEDILAEIQKEQEPMNGQASQDNQSQP